MAFVCTACSATCLAQNIEQETDSAIIELRKELLNTTLPPDATLPKEAVLPNNSGLNNAALPKDAVLGNNAAITTNPSLSSLPPMRWYGLPKERGNRLPHWATGGLTGYHGSVYNPMGISYNYAAVGITQSLGRYWSASANVEASKSPYFFTADVMGSVQYRPSQNFGITVFGSYQPGNFNNGMAIGQGYYYGGYVTFESDNHWGIDLGAAHGYNTMTGQYTTPIVKPYYNLNGAKIGIDFGPMIQHWMQRGRGNSDQLEFSPTMPRPIKSMPPVAPRR